MILNFPALETGLTNSCFFILFLTTSFYWIKIIIYPTTNNNFIGVLGHCLSNGLITIQLIFRWVSSGHFPLSNLYESLLFLAWALLLFYIFIETQTQADFLGVVISPAILCLVAFTSFCLPVELQQSHSLVPALQSNWLVMHVTVMIISYASLLLGCLVSILYIVLYYSFQFNSLELTNKKSFQDENLSQNTVTSLNFAKLTFSFNDKKYFLDFLDGLSYRTISVGFCFLTLGILSGAVWANETWGSYWSWDPKETWALITWLTFATYLHTRLIRGWEGLKPSYIASLGFILVWVCYLGVNLLGKGLHSYGFFSL